MADRPPREHILVKKYANRRLYDTVHSQYVNLRQISDLIREGHTVEVVDASTGEDLSKVILTQIILEEERGQRNLLPVDFLHRIIQDGESAYERFLEKGLEAGLTAYRAAQEQMESALRGWMQPWVELSETDSRKELETLRARVAELEARLETSSRGPPRAS
ncbi:MAG: polyhydroxyalkanoate synthesis regulator DNA-binding domain-containing protein [Deferrisomatales bacterium]|nr:polyhydroxyalkanoate synthesis regulator DNA-binding domain-containing protein [Deferrisomatales bacterium]